MTVLAAADLAVVTDQLRECGECGWWTRWTDRRGRCRNCTLGWQQCLRHGRLEWARSDHQRVTVHQVTRAVPEVGQ